MSLTGNHLLRAHHKIYGTEVSRKPSKVSKLAGEEDSFTYTCEKSFRAVKQTRRELVLASMTFDITNPKKQIERFTVDGVGPVCSECCRAAHGIPEGSWNKLLADARAAPAAGSSFNGSGFPTVGMPGSSSGLGINESKW